ncbi:MAG: branched-chain amino acid aminotransferase [Actinomycetota bacterium]|nr:branched-chain amino acid aminotransferase [Actinomycetota bacterium]
MKPTLPFTRTPNPDPATPERVAEVLAKPGFGQFFTDHMVTIRHSREHGWHDARVEPYGPLALDPSVSVLHYGQAIFEGLKVYRQPDGSIAYFRPEANAARFRASAARIAMPQLPDDLFLSSISELVDVDRHWVPDRLEESLYLRPFMISTEAALGVRPSSEYLYVVIASPAGAYFAGGVKPVSVWLCTEYVRAAPGGTGAAKFAGNYAASLIAQAQAAEQGCDQVVWLDAVERKYVEEVGVMNLFFVLGSGQDTRIVTPQLSGSLLAGITRDSIVRLATDLGYPVEERRFSTEEWEATAKSGELTEVFACGTAAVVTPVGHVKHANGAFDIADAGTGPVTMQLRETLTAIQYGAVDDQYGWMTKL